ncbi:uncharacterized protein LOC124672760 [Lolium rigidum]|uniref:uncharacterized protein LOC124672760 n=1 Tax=Lolium rigidum TaxID=89674 RepID=UPI001F5D47E0|nr:uncharacterized protein LOC124672760 [Lolium rigidum]XP_047064890.1 uncharacterized protein LOC124672760 [Lolium rigidum]XP_047064892.1 uncharacterized protein LOC124672760 [Lolium rigidum]XP_047064893.1 uncharacterized protein LOC124672760 [Lolium rigidum]XP_047064894.1 uncharacterized protein LOC124672760 [Lolium rigidum]XP_047064895.1 uncharacterized protein LOC124672760 [Lolium rigidum]
MTNQAGHVHTDTILPRGSAQTKNRFRRAATAIRLVYVLQEEEDQILDIQVLGLFLRKFLCSLFIVMIAWILESWHMQGGAVRYWFGEWVYARFTWQSFHSGLLIVS